MKNENILRELTVLVAKQEIQGCTDRIWVRIWICPNALTEELMTALQEFCLKHP